MDKGIFGSTCSLGGLLNDALFTESEADQFLGELDCPVSKGLAFFPAMETASGADSLGSNLTGDQGGFKSDAVSDVFATPASSNQGLPSNLSAAESAPTQAWSADALKPTASSLPQPTSGAAPAPNSLALLTQLVSVIQAAQQPHPANPQAQLGAVAFKPSAVQPFAHIKQPVAQPTVPTPVLPATTPAAPALPSLTAQQQQALQAIMSIGNLGNTVEGKKVRRMLSNRESARRSRHRKQAHVQELEDKAARLEAENTAMKQALTAATGLEAQSSQERERLCAEIASLRRKVEQLEGHAAKEGVVKTEGDNRPHSHLSSAAGGVSEDSCCDSMPSKRMAEAAEELCCKRCRATAA